MPAFTVSLDDSVLACVCTDGYDVLSIRVGGTRVDDEFATIDLSAGAYPEGGPSTHLIWLNSVAVLPGQRIEVEMSDRGETTRPGKTIEDLFPDEEPSSPVDFKPTSEIFAELRRLPSLRDGYTFEVTSPTGEVHRTSSTPDEHGFGFTVLWNSYQPERASVSLHTYTIDSVEQRSPGSDHLREYFKPTQTVAIKIDA